MLAVAFLAFVLASNDLARGLAGRGGEDILRQLAGSGYDIEPGTGAIQATGKERWLVILSLLVCVVGIVNAQLMSVTERFREIGIMKCLGALDAIIMRLFLLEAGMQGIAGSLAGVVLGSFFALLAGLARFGWAALANLAWTGLLWSMAISVLTGLVLSLIGVAYPAILAARMRPVLALKAEH